MRRKDREVTDSQKIREIILSCRCCRLGFYDNGEVYIVPLDFGYYENNGRHVFYFHGAKEGRKYRLTEKSPTVGFELDTNQQLVRGGKSMRVYFQVSKRDWYRKGYHSQEGKR